MTVVMKAEFAQSYRAQARSSGRWRPSRPRIVRLSSLTDRSLSQARPPAASGMDSRETVTGSPWLTRSFILVACRQFPRTLQPRRLPIRGVRGLDRAADRPPRRRRGPPDPAVLRPAGAADPAPGRGGLPARHHGRRVERRRGLRRRAHPGRAQPAARARGRPARAGVHPHGVAPRLSVRPSRRARGRGRGDLSRRRTTPAAPPTAAPVAPSGDPFEDGAAAPPGRLSPRARTGSPRAARPRRRSTRSAPRRRCAAWTAAPATRPRAPCCATRGGTSPARARCRSSASPAASAPPRC